ncbi:MAG: hypothetical protein DRI36_00170 [Caldiserica bacterium]|nr:MAG: hypothetical protein DRI36_00170 [Caldisericota bacterium]
MIGIISGNLISILILELLKKYKFIHLPQSVYYLNYLPINIRITDFILVDIVALILSLFATYFPARRASKIEPAMSLRYE